MKTPKSKKSNRPNYKKLYLNLSKRVSAMHTLASCINPSSELGRAMRKIAFGHDVVYQYQQIKAKP